MKNFGNINTTRFGFESNKEQDEEPCFCWLHSRLVISIREWSADEIATDKLGGGKGSKFDYHSSHALTVFCSKDIQPIESFRANFIADNYVAISWDIYKMCGGCDTKKLKNFGCKAFERLCRENDDGGFTSNYKKLWKLRSVLKQEETTVKGICKDIRKSFKKCKFDMACKQTKKVCEGSGSKYF